MTRALDWMVTNLVDNHDEGRWCTVLLGPGVSDVVRKKGVCAAEYTVGMKLNSGVKTFAGSGCATLASASALPGSASRNCEWQICLLVVTCRRGATVSHPRSFSSTRSFLSCT